MATHNLYTKELHRWLCLFFLIHNGRYCIYSSCLHQMESSGRSYNRHSISVATCRPWKHNSPKNYNNTLTTAPHVCILLSKLHVSLLLFVFVYEEWLSNVKYEIFFNCLQWGNQMICQWFWWITCWAINRYLRRASWYLVSHMHVVGPNTRKKTNPPPNRPSTPVSLFIIDW